MQFAALDGFIHELLWRKMCDNLKLMLRSKIRILCSTSWYLVRQTGALKYRRIRRNAKPEVFLLSVWVVKARARLARAEDKA